MPNPHSAFLRPLPLALALLASACGGETQPPETADGSPPVTEPVTEPVPAPLPAPTEDAAAPTEAGAVAAHSGDAPLPAPVPDAPGSDETAPRNPSETLPEPGARSPSPPAVPPEPVLSGDVREALRAARAQRDAGDPGAAARALRAAEAEFGDDASLRLEAAWCFFDQAKAGFEAGADGFLVKSNVADAQLRLDQIESLRGPDAPPLPGEAVLRAKVYRYSENPKAARETLTTHLATWGGDIAAHRELADMASTAKEWDLADTHWTRVAEADPSDGRARLNATIAKQWLTGEGGAAYDAQVLHDGYRTAARLLPEDADPLRLLVGLYPNDAAARVAAMDDVISDNAGAVWARVWKAYLLRQAGGDATAKALDVLVEAARLAPDNEGVAMNRAETLQELGRLQDAVTVYIECVAAGEPGTREAASNALDVALHGSAEARGLPAALRERAYAALCDANPTIGRFGNNAGLWYRDVVQDYDKSLKWYQRSVDAEPEDQDYINDTALIYLFHLRDRKEVSLPMFLKVRRLVEDEGQEPIRGYWDTLENLCKYYFEIGQYDKVVECADRRANPDAVVNDRPYPSARAAAYRNQALKKLGEVK